jgi:hypothetical protein
MQQIILDDWQKEILECDDNILIAKGRRIGATHIMAEKAIEYLMTHENHHPTSQIVCVSLVEDQAKLIIAFALQYADSKYKKYIGKGKDKPTLDRIIMIVNGNRRILMAKPVGNTGDSVRGFEGQVLMVDEAPRMPKLFWAAAKPILLTTGGKIWMWGTFCGEEGYFWERWSDQESRFKKWNKNTEEVIFNRPISESWTKEQREEAINLLAEEKKEMSELEYAQEYLAIPSHNLKHFFDDDLIERVCHLKRPEQEQVPIILEMGYRYSGHDLARMGGDQFTTEVLWKREGKRIKQIDSYSQKRLLTTRNEDLIKENDLKWKNTQIGIDAGAGTLGVSVLDHLLKPDSPVKKKVVAMNNRQVSMDDDDDGKQKLFKEDLYDNLKSMMEMGEIELLDDDEIKLSLRSIQMEFIKDIHGVTKIRISGNFSHHAEGLIRAAWLANQKSLNLSISYI